MKHFYSIISVALAVLLTACSDTDSINGDVDIPTWDIATFEGYASGQSVFTLRQADDSPLVTLTAPVDVSSEDLAPGRRVYIAYVPADNIPYRSGAIRLLSVSPITQSSVTPVSFQSPVRWDADPVYVITLWRTGSYLNLYCRLPYTETPRSFGLIVDKATLDSASPQLYIEHRLTKPVNTFTRAYYASFDISSVWNLPSVSAVDVHVNNSNLPVTTYSFAK